MSERQDKVLRCQRHRTWFYVVTQTGQGSSSSERQDKVLGCQRETGHSSK